MANIIEIRIRATDETQALYDKVKAKAAEEGAAAGEEFSAAYQRAARDYEPITPSRTTSARRFNYGPTPEEIAEQKAQIAALRQEFDQEAAAATDDALKDVIDPSGPTGTKIREDAKKTGQDAGKDMGGAMSPLIASALVGGAAVGAPLLLAGLGTAFVGITALALKSNVAIANDYTQLGKTAAKALTDAAAPAAGTLHQALTGMESTVQQLTPELKGLFVNAEPDITAVAGGVDAFAKGILPGMSDAVKSSQVIVQDFGQSMGPLGQNVGGFFQGLTRDAYTTGAGMESLLGTVGHLANTLGGVLGSAASVGSTALMGLDPVLNTVLSVVQKIDSPGVIGAGGGLFAAFKLDPAISSGLKAAASGVETLGIKALSAGGMIGKTVPALEGMSGALSKGAGIMAGPWGLAVGAGVGLVTGLVGAIINAAHASDALTLSQQGLQQAVAQDNGHIGQATTAYVAAQAQADGLAKSAAAAGVSLTTWTQAVLGNKDAQKLVADAVSTTNASTLNQQIITDDAARSTGKYSDESRDAKTAVEAQSVATGKLTSQNQQLMSSMAAQNKQIVDAINKQQQLTAATNQLMNAQTILGASLKAQYQSQVAAAQQSAITTVASLDLGDANIGLSQSLYGTVDAYDQAQAEGNAYVSVLDALSGSTNALLGTEAAFTTSLGNLTKATKGHTDSLNVNTAAGAANITKITQIATAADKAAGAVYQSEVGTKGATQAYNDANATLATMKQRFIDAADEAGYSKAQVKALADQLFQLPKNISVGVDTTLAKQGLQRLVQQINGSSATVTVYENSSGQVFSSGGGNKAQATGGNYGGAAATGGARGNLVKVGEQGTEFVRLPFGSTVIPHSNVQSMTAGPGAGSGAGGAFEFHFTGNTDTAFASAFMLLIRNGNIQIKQKAIVP